MIGAHTRKVVVLELHPDEAEVLMRGLADFKTEPEDTKLDEVLNAIYSALEDEL